MNGDNTLASMRALNFVNGKKMISGQTTATNNNPIEMTHPYLFKR